MEKKEQKQLIKQKIKWIKKNYRPLYDLVQLIYADLLEDWDKVMVAEGDEGVGKSILLFWIQLIRNQDFDFMKYMMLQPSVRQVLGTQGKLPKYSATVLDEGITLLYKKDHNKKATKLIEKYYNINRKENRLSLIGIPDMMDLTKYFREHRVTYRLMVIERGVALLFARDKHNKKDRWFEGWMEKAKKKSFGNKSFVFVDEEEIINFYKKVPNFVRVIRFPDIEEPFKSTYLKEKDKVEIRFDEEEEERITLAGLMNPKYVIKLFDYYRTQSTKKPRSTVEVATFFKVSVRSIRYWVESVKNYRRGNEAGENEK